MSALRPKRRASKPTNAATPFYPVVLAISLAPMCNSPCGRSPPLIFKDHCFYNGTPHPSLIIRNTGHDYLGKLTGAGAVAIWTHHLKNIGSSVISPRRTRVKRPRLLSDCQVSYGLHPGRRPRSTHLPVLVGGQSGTGVGSHQRDGPAGYGDTARRVYRISTRRFLGDGVGPYGVVISIVSKAYPEWRMATVNLSFTSLGAAHKDFDDVVDIFFNHTLDPLLDARWTSVWFLASSIVHDGADNHLRWIKGTAAAHLGSGPCRAGQDQHRILYVILLTFRLKQELARISLSTNNLRSPAAYDIDKLPSFDSSVETMSPVVNATESNLGGRFIPRSVLGSEPSALTNQFRRGADYGAIISSVSVDASRSDHQIPNNPMNPAWRTAATDVVVGTCVVPVLLAIAASDFIQMKDPKLHQPNT
ncbi:hypothetical protein BBP40_004737 [Aspergillus hancockii]|nr:hypothetical protein BBP40_004737 [Aspergillus hancockii]